MDNPREILTDAVAEVAEAEARQVEDAITTAILGGYDGVDVIRYAPAMATADDDRLTTLSTTGKIEPWTYGDDGPPLPKPSEHATRYEWKWFDRDRLKQAIVDGNVVDYVNGDVDA